MSQPNDEIQPIYEIGYWAEIRGQVHPIILLLEHLKIKYTQRGFKSREEWFENEKPLQACLTPFPNLPYLKKGDLIITESQAIIAFISYESGRFDLLGREPFNTVQIIQIQGVLSDLRRDIFKLLGDKQNYEKIKEKFLEDTIYPRLELINKSLRGGFLIGDLSMVDFQMFETIDMILKLIPTILKDYNLLEDYYNKVAELDGVKEYIQSDTFKQLNFFPKGYMAVDL